MAVMSLMVTMTDDEQKILACIAEDQMRSPKQQAAWLLIQAIRAYRDDNEFVIVDLDTPRPTHEAQ